MEIAHSAPLARRLEVGASLAVAGVCLTVTSLDSDPANDAMVSTVEVAPETLRRTSLGGLSEGDSVNLEPALRMGDALGGHWVQGHVDGLGVVAQREDLAAHRELTISLTPELGRYVVEKGSVTLDGVSLTVAGRPNDSTSADGESTTEMRVALIPHTLEETTLGELIPGSRVHVEVDVLAKYVERLLGQGSLPATGGDR